MPVTSYTSRLRLRVPFPFAFPDSFRKSLIPRVLKNETSTHSSLVLPGVFLSTTSSFVRAFVVETSSLIGLLHVAQQSLIFRLSVIMSNLLLFRFRKRRETNARYAVECILSN